MLQAEQVLMACRSVARDRNVSRQTAVRCLGHPNVFTARLVVSKKHDQCFTNVEGVGKNFVKELMEAGTGVKRPWASQSFEAAAPAEARPELRPAQPGRTIYRAGGLGVAERKSPSAPG